MTDKTDLLVASETVLPEVHVGQGGIYRAWAQRAPTSIFGEV